MLFRSEYEYVVRWSRLAYLQRVTMIFRHPSLAARSTKRQITQLLWPQCKWALLASAHEQLKSGEITLAEWLTTATTFSLHLFSSLAPLDAARKSLTIAGIPFQIYSPWYVLTLGAHRLKRTLLLLLPGPGRPERV